MSVPWPGESNPTHVLVVQLDDVTTFEAEQWARFIVADDGGYLHSDATPQVRILRDGEDIGWEPEQ